MKKTKNKKVSHSNFIFMKLYATSVKFGKSMLEIEKKWQIPRDAKKTNELYNLLGNVNELNAEKEAKILRKEFFDKIGEKRHEEYLRDVKKFINEYNLGENWTEPLIDFFICQWMRWPTAMINLKELTECKKKNKIIIELNPHTTLNDVKDIWRDVEDYKKKIWPHIKPLRITKKAVNNLSDFLYVVMYKFLTEEETGKKPRYLDIIASLYENEIDISKKADIKRANRIKKVISRMKKGDNTNT